MASAAKHHKNPETYHITISHNTIRPFTPCEYQWALIPFVLQNSVLLPIGEISVDGNAPKTMQTMRMRQMVASYPHPHMLDKHLTYAIMCMKRLLETLTIATSAEL